MVIAVRLEYHAFVLGMLVEVEMYFYISEVLN